MQQSMLGHARLFGHMHMWADSSSEQTAANCAHSSHPLRQSRVTPSQRQRDPPQMAAHLTRIVLEPAFQAHFAVRHALLPVRPYLAWHTRLCDLITVPSHPCTTRALKLHPQGLPLPVRQLFNVHVAGAVAATLCDVVRDIRPGQATAILGQLDGSKALVGAGDGLGLGALWDDEGVDCSGMRGQSGQILLEQAEVLRVVGRD
jgi:hypothetical protein